MTGNQVIRLHLAEQGYQMATLVDDVWAAERVDAARRRPPQLVSQIFCPHVRRHQEGQLARDNIYVFIDNAHRSVAKELGSYLMAALPKATIIGFTGTPVGGAKGGSWLVPDLRPAGR